MRNVGLLFSLSLIGVLSLVACRFAGSVGVAESDHQEGQPCNSEAHQQLHRELVRLFKQWHQAHPTDTEGRRALLGTLHEKHEAFHQAILHRKPCPVSLISSSESSDAASDDVFHGAAAESSSSTVPSIDLTRVDEKTFGTIKTLVMQYDAEHRTITRESGVVQDVLKGLQNLQTMFEQHTKIYGPYVPYAINVQNQILAQPFAVLKKILSNEGYSVE